MALGQEQIEQVEQQLDVLLCFPVLNWQLINLDPFKSPGGDGIFPALLQEGPECLYIYLCELFKENLIYGYITYAWCLNRVDYIEKMGHSNYSNLKSFHPISLTSVLLKTLEILVERYLKKWALSDTPFHCNQHPYQPGKLCEAAMMHQLLCRIEDGMVAGEIVPCAFLDIESAFDNTSFDAMVHGLCKHEADPIACGWLVLC